MIHYLPPSSNSKRECYAATDDKPTTRPRAVKVAGDQPGQPRQKPGENWSTTAAPVLNWGDGRAVGGFITVWEAKRVLRAALAGLVTASVIIGMVLKSQS